MKSSHMVTVGNVGKVTNNETYAEAERAFREYRHLSVINYGRVAGESVTWWRNDEIYKEYIGAMDKGASENDHTY